MGLSSLTMNPEAPSRRRFGLKNSRINLKTPDAILHASSACTIFPIMTNMITVRDIDPADKNWLKAEAKRQGVSMEELVRRMIREKRVRVQLEEKPSEVILRLFGPKHGVKLPPRTRFRMRPADFE
jgi:hypothetical protein